MAQQGCYKPCDCPEVNECSSGMQLCWPHNLRKLFCVLKSDKRKVCALIQHAFEAVPVQAILANLVMHTMPTPLLHPTCMSLS
jgi:hypothetical protein